VRIFRSIEGSDTVIVLDRERDMIKTEGGLNRVIANVGYIDQQHYVSTMAIKGVSRLVVDYSGLAGHRQDKAGAVWQVDDETIEEGEAEASTMLASRLMQSTPLPTSQTVCNSWSNVWCQI